MDAAFKRAATPPVCRVLGLRLEPLKVGHLIALRKHTPVFLEGEEPDFGDLLTAVFICAHPWQDCESHLSAWWLKLYITIWKWRVRKIFIWRELSNFNSYLFDSIKGPIAMHLRAKARNIESPYEWGLVATLMGDFGMQICDAKNMPVSEALAVIAVNSERLGSIELAGERRLALIETAKRGDSQLERN